MTDDFMLVDFVLVQARAAEVTKALGEIAQSRRGGSRDRAPRGQRTNAGLGGLISRILPARSGRSVGPVLQLHPSGHLPSAPLARVMPDDLGFGTVTSAFRVSAPIGGADLVLIEFREGDSQSSTVAAALSSLLPHLEVFYFRLSGQRHPGSETAFHIYRDGAPIRRVASVSASGTMPEAHWQVTDTGLPHPVEADSLPAARARAWEIMTPERQGAILTSMDVDPDTLFSEDPTRIVVELSTEPGGQGLHEAWRLFSQPPVQPSPEPEPEPEPPEPTREPEGESPLLGEHGETAPPLGAEASTQSTPTPSPQHAGETDSTWDSEVTDLLVTAVAFALPEEEQIPWLTHLTAELEAGNVESALKEARALIQMGNRPPEERDADAARLDALFGITSPPRP